MTIDVAIYDRLRASTPVSTFVLDRIYPGGRAPQNVQSPWITFLRDNTAPVVAMGQDTGLVRVEYEVVCYSDASVGGGFTEVRLLADHVIAALNRWRDSTGNASVLVDSSFLDGDHGGYDDGEEIWEIALDFRIHYSEVATP